MRIFLLRIVACSDADRTGEEIRVTGEATIGREPGCTVVLAERLVSRRHARIEPASDGVRIVDLGSHNGTWLDVERVTDIVLQPGQQCRIGTTVFECCEEAPPPPAVVAPQAPTELIPQEALADVPPFASGAFIIRVLTGGEKVQEGAEFVVDGEAIIGRAADSTVVINERDVSRKHARITITPDGFLVTDLGSTGGVWIGGQQIASQIVAPGEAVRLGGRITVECRPPIGAAESPVEEDGTRLISAAELERLRQAEAPAAPPAAMPVPSAAPAALAGPAFAAPVAAPQAPEGVAAPVIAAAPAQAVPASAAVGLAPSPLAVPVAIEPELAVRESPADVRVPAAEPPPPIGRTAPVPAPSGVTDADFGHSVMIPAAPEVAATMRVEDLGELQQVSAHEPFLIDDPNAVYYVVTGGILLFTVAIEKGEPVGTRTHFLGINPGQCFFGFDLERYGTASGFLAVAKQGTSVRKIELGRLQELAKSRAQAPMIAALVDTWLSGLSKALVQDFPIKRSDAVQLVAGQRLEIDSKGRVTSSEGVVWVDIWSGSILFDDMATPVFAQRRALFPVTPDSWIQPISDEFGALSITPVRTADTLGDDAVWYALDIFHQVLCECEFINKRLATVDEYVRLQQKAQHREAAQEAAYDAIGSVMRPEAAAPQEFLATGSTEPVFRACSLVGQRLGITVREHPSAEEGLTYEERVSAIASASGFRTRVVALRGDWWTEDHGPLLGQMAATREAVALLPTSATSYDRVDPKTQARTRINAQNAEELSVFAFSLYRPFPEGKLEVGDVLRFGVRDMTGDFRWVLLMAIIVGVFGTVTPYLTGRVFDDAVPQADRNALFVFGTALLLSAIATSLFKLVQGVATVRIQARMGTSIQSAVWDRIMNLPATFFRTYSAGDLADRAEGVDAIQELVSGAGVAAILGSVSGLFYVGQMFGYDLRLALLAIVLTIVFVGANMTANYLQLRYQRQEMQLRGSIAGLVLNLLTGVSKLRTCGSELHAFRVWAERFAQQRKISFTSGNIQSIAAVVGTIFPVLSNIFIFWVVIGERSEASAGAPAMTTGDFVAFTSAFGLFMAAMQSLGDASLSLLRIVPIYERLKPILDCKAEVDPSKAFPGKLKGEIELSHLNFRYDADGPWIIKDLSLKIKAGEFVAFVGGSGCGKSTLMRLMLGFEVPASGSIYYDGQDLSQLDLRMVRQQMGVVLQVSRLMPTEIYRNIIGVSSKTIEDAWWAAERAGLADDIRGMPMGMHTYVSEGGGTLSGGQRQRLMIARSIVNKPKILFLDEATSALDNKSQAIVTQSMDRMEATRIVIAHRLSTIINADRICYMEAGHIAEMGNYKELMELNGLFAQLAKRQMA